MKSLNFEFLRTLHPELAELGGFAEAYAAGDPTGAVGKLRIFAEKMVDELYARLGLELPFPDADLFERMTASSFETAVPEAVKSKLHALRKQGNKASHGEKTGSDTALWLVEEAFLLGSWMHVALDRGAKEDCGHFRKPPTEPEAKADPEIRRRLAEKERALAELITERDNLRAELKQTREEIEQTQQRLQPAILELNLSEEDTRRNLIDRELASAGWNIGPKGQSTTEVGQEVEVPNQPTDSGIGYADYVLWDDDGTPLAVIEAKKTLKQAEAGQTQAKIYADGLESKYGARPVIFYTNGIEIWIWDDAQGLPPRPVQGFYDRDSLRYLRFQREKKSDLSTLMLNEDIAGRLYQMEAIKRVLERFEGNHRRTLIVMATGTGKTRVAVSMTEALFRAKWVRRVLFVCDRRELRKQAAGVFQEFLPGEPPVIVGARTAENREGRIYLATYPAMAKIFETFDVGFFDLIIADESHRSIYRKYRHLFNYFDALQVGLTATPVGSINRNTYRMFGCADQDPTAYYSFEEAISDSPPSLVPFEVFSHTTQFLRTGIKYTELNDDQRTELEDQIEDAESLAFEPGQIDRQIFNKDTNRKILENLMDNGIRDQTGALPGKTIIFARNHNHAVLLQNLFDEMYPQYGGTLCRVIDNYDPRADELIDEFKIFDSRLVIAISVDMLDTGIDVPEIVNLVFAKPLGSYVKFWQMIGRGTRLRQNLFGPGEDKTIFRIFDHWGNFDFFGERYKESEPARQKALTERLFETRLDLARTAVEAADAESLDLAADLMLKLLKELDERSVPVRAKWRELRSVRNLEVLRRLEPTTDHLLASVIAPLTQWIDIGRHEKALRFDVLIARAQVELLKGTAKFENLRGDIRNLVARLPINLSQVRRHQALINQVAGDPFWESPTVADLETVRIALRDVILFAAGRIDPKLMPTVVDITEDPYLIETRELRVAEPGVTFAAYRTRVDSVLKALLATNPVLQKIQAGQAVGPDDLEQLRELVLAQSSVDLDQLIRLQPETRRSLEVTIRAIIGLDAEAVDRVFTVFVHNHPDLSARQMRFLGLLKNHIARYGSIELERLYEPPFTTLHTDSVDGIFEDTDEVNDLLAVLARFEQPDIMTGVTAG